MGRKLTSLMFFSHRQFHLYIFGTFWISYKSHFIQTLYKLVYLVVCATKKSKWLTKKKPGEGYFHQNRTWMCLPNVKNLTFSIPIFCLISHPSINHFWKKSTQFWPNWVLFTIICPKYTQFMYFGLLRLWWKSPDHFTKFCEKAPQKAGTYIYV